MDISKDIFDETSNILIVDDLDGDHNSLIEFGDLVEDLDHCEGALWFA